MAARDRCRARGFTLVELMVVVAIAAVLLTLVAPSFTNYFARKRLEGVFTEFATDIQYARSEAVQRNVPVRITFGSGCYAIHTHPVGSTATSCTQAGGVTLGTGSIPLAMEIKTVQLDTGSALSISPRNSLTFIQFDSIRGMATFDGSVTTVGSVNLTTSAGSWQLRASITPVGRAQTCSPNGSVVGYDATCI